MDSNNKIFSFESVTIYNEDVLKLYYDWITPNVIISDRVNNLIYSLPNYFETDLIIKGINATEIFSIGSAFTTIIDSQVVDILNRHRSIWDPENEYSNYMFVRQSQTFPDVLLRNIENEKDILFGIELKSWYVLSRGKNQSLD